jgi:hypothetical protein
MNTNINESYKTTQSVCPDNKGKFCWSAIIAGALVGIGASFLLNLFALALGVTAFIYTDSTQTFAIGGFIALVIIAIASMGSLGWISGYLGAKNKICCSKHVQCDSNTCHLGCIYGFIAWCLALILTIFLSTHVGKFIAFQRIVISHPNYLTENQVNWPSRPLITTRTTSDQRSINRNEEKPVVQEDAAKALAMTTFITFVLFFIGALSATIAGHCGFNACFKYSKKYD